MVETQSTGSPSSARRLGRAAALTAATWALVASAGACGDDGGGPGVDAGLQADLRIEQPVTVVVVDDEVVFTIVVSNQGPDAVVDAGLTTVLPPGITVVNATCAAQGAASCGGTSTAGTVSWSGLDLEVAANNSNTVTLRVIAVPTKLGPASLSAAIVVPPAVTDPDLSADSNTAERSYDARLARVAGPGGRVDWYRGGVLGSIAESRPVAFDRAPPAAATTTEVFLASPDMGTTSCVTCGMTFPRGQGFVGNPSWHPDGGYLVVQVENMASTHGAYDGPAWGVDSDLWIIKADGSWAGRIWDSRTGPDRGAHNGALHPVFSPDGRLLVFAERWATGSHGAATMWPGTDGQDPWRGWGLRVLRLDQTLLGDPKYQNLDVPMVLESIRIAPNEAAVLPRGDATGNGRYDPVSISSTGAVRYAFTPAPRVGAMNNQYVDATYACTLSSVTTLAGATCTPPTVVAGANVETWDDLVQPVPGGTRQSFASSRIDPQWRAQASSSSSTATTLRTELYVMDSGDEAGATALTAMNALGDPGRRFAVGYHQWSSDGSRVVFAVSRTNVSTGMPLPSETWIMAVP